MAMSTELLRVHLSLSASLPSYGQLEHMCVGYFGGSSL